MLRALGQRHKKTCNLYIKASLTNLPVKLQPIHPSGPHVGPQCRVCMWHMCLGCQSKQSEKNKHRNKQFYFFIHKHEVFITIIKTGQLMLLKFNLLKIYEVKDKGRLPHCCFKCMTQKSSSCNSRKNCYYTNSSLCKL